MSLHSLLLTYWNSRYAERQRERDHQIQLLELENQRIREAEVCSSCEALKLELSRLHDQNNELIAGILQKPTEEARIDTTELKPIKPKSVPWGIRRQMLETEDRAKAKILRDQAKERQQTVAEAKPTLVINAAALNEPTSVSELERELGVSNGN